MQKLKVAFIGVGSIAKRHIRNLRGICASRGITLRIDALRRQQTSPPVDGIDFTFCDPAQMPSDYDVVFITNPTEYHLDALQKFHEKGRHFFIEKPAVSVGQLNAALQFPCRQESLYYVACPLRYNAVIQYMKKDLDLSDVISVRSISSSYLPDWRPGQDYRNTYSAHRDLGGGVSIDLIHEWDYLTYLFGWPEKISCMIGKKSVLELDSDDFAIYLAEYPRMIAELHLDYFGRKTIRECLLIKNEDTIVCDIANGIVRSLVTGRSVDCTEERDAFQKRELAHFLDMVFGDAPLEDGFRHGLRVLRLTQGRI